MEMVSYLRVLFVSCSLIYEVDILIEKTENVPTDLQSLMMINGHVNGSSIWETSG